MRIISETYKQRMSELAGTNQINFESIAKQGITTDIPFKGLEIRMRDLIKAQEDLSNNKPSVTPDAPVEVMFNITNDTKELLDGYHRYLLARGGDIEKAKNNGSINGKIKAIVKFEINEMGGGFNRTREATGEEIKMAYNDMKNIELRKIIDQTK